MKNTTKLLFLLTIILATACQKEIDPYEIPEGLEEKRTFLKEKQEEVRKLTKIVKDVEGQIAELDPESVAEDKLVKVEQVATGTLQHFVDVQGTVVAKDFANASSEIGGRLLSVNGTEGQYVRRGQLIATVDVESINKQIAEVETSLSLAKDTYARQERLWNQKIGSEMQYLQAKNNVDRLEQSLETLRHQLTKANVYAPIAGSIDVMNKEAGEVAGPGEPIVRILNTTKLTAEIDVPENYLKSVGRGSKVNVELPAIDEVFEARVSRLSNSIDPSSRSFKLEIPIPSRIKLAKPNLLATMKLQDEVAENVVIVPLELIQQEVTGKDYMLVLDDSGEKPVAKKKYVTTGLSYDGSIAITEGLSTGDKIITLGALGLADGDRVTLASN